MRSRWRRTGAVILLVVPFGACSDPTVDFPAMDAQNDVSADTSADISSRPDVITTVDARDAGVDVCACTDVTGNDAIDTGAPETPGADRDGTSADVPTDTNDAQNPDASDAVSEPAVDGAADAVEEDGGTCESHCASGVCDTNGNCAPCVKDSECTGGRVCNAGTCGQPCGDGGVMCTGNLVCCTDHCVDTTRDPQHCGACGTTCSATQFCANASTPVCKDNILGNVCNSKKATFLLDGLTADDTASGIIKNAIAALCVPAPTTTSVLQTVTPTVNSTTGQPLVGGGELLVAAGGDSWQHLVRYLETSRTSSVYNETDGVTQLQFKRHGATDAGDSVIITVPLSMATATHDYFLVEVVKDPISGTFSLVIYGIESPGTTAGAFYFANFMLPSIAGADVTTFTQGWYLYEWTSADAGAGGPTMTDTFTQIASGP